jgi:hypothetical protein
MKPRRKGCGLQTVAVETIASARALGAPRPAGVRLAHQLNRSEKASTGHRRCALRIFLAWLTIRRQNDRLALPYGSGT